MLIDDPNRSAARHAAPLSRASLPFSLRVRVVRETDLSRRQPFQQITDLTDVAEGTIVRVITRLDETCREVRDAARVIGDAELFKKMEEAQNLIKRDSKWIFWSCAHCSSLTGAPPCVQLCLLQACTSKCPRK